MSLALKICRFETKGNERKRDATKQTETKKKEKTETTWNKNENESESKNENEGETKWKETERTGPERNEMKHNEWKKERMN